ncbi:cyclin-dependent kinase 4-like [Palaemon carinicauda]|uniref:cyclin-dependent kinase 4-like n=1 Tax=Palaemon carinicauda TaxID=392227 RepID=UPI0035B5DD2F
MTMASSGSGAGESGGGKTGGGSRAPPPATEGPQQPPVTAPTAAATATAASVSSVADLPKANESYEEVSIIGNGAYGTVYLARDRNNTDRAVALKKIRITLHEDIGVPVNAVREIALLKQLERFEHPNIVRLLDICQGRVETGPRSEREQRLNLVLVFEYVDQDLDHYLKRCPSPGLEPARIKNLMHQILCGVDFLHSNRVIHRDLKPQNILVDRAGRVKIADFGLARIYDFNMRLTTQVVTLWYRAPEILLSNTYATPSDLWSCGCIFAELFRRVPIFKGNTEGDQLQRIFDIIGTPHENDWPRDVSLCRSNFRHLPGRHVSDIVPEITDDAADLLEKMLKFVPSRRISAIEALRHPYFRGLNTPRVMATSNRSTPTQQVLSPAPLATSSPTNLHLQRHIATSTANTVNVTAANTSEHATLPSQVTANDENNPNAGNSANTNPVVSMMPEPKVAERAITVANASSTDTSVTSTTVTASSGGIHPPPGNSSNTV